MKMLLNKSKRGEKGQALVLVLILMTIGGLIIAPLLSYMSSGLKVEEKYEYIADEFYAADAGVTDGLWQIKYTDLTSLWSDYEEYDYDTVYDYDDSSPVHAVEVNDIPVDVTIENVWIPKDIDEPTSDYAHQLIERNPAQDRPTLMINDNVSAPLTQKIKIDYYRGSESLNALQVNKIGIWLPPGFSYDTTGACTLETWLNASHKTYSRQIITPYCGGQAVVWTLTNVLFTDLPGASTSDDPINSTFTFLFQPDDPESERTPEAISWITTSGVSDIPYTWDANVQVYHITSQAGGDDGTTIDAYAIKSGVRKMGSAVSGDYRAIGATLMIEGSGHGYNPSDIRYELLPENNAVAIDIPANAQVDAAFLYWSAWIDDPAPITIWGTENCDNFTAPIMNWTPGSRWTIDPPSGPGNKQFRGRGGGTATQQTLAMNSSIDLHAYTGQEVTVTWNQTKQGTLSSGDALYYAFYNGSWSTDYVAFQGNSTPTNPFISVPIPEAYLTSNFKMRFYFNFANTNKYVYLDNIKITAVSEVEADTSVIFEINSNPVYFADDEHGNPTIPTIGSEEIPADRSKLLQNFTGGGEPNGYSYACYKDVTGLLQAFSNHGEGENRTGNGTYTLGNVYGDTGNEWSYAAWSLIIIYSSPETKGHQLYLYDDDLLIYSGMDCHVDWDGDGQAGGTISGFLVPDPITGEVNAAQITCFVAEGDECYGDDPPDDIDYIMLNEHKLSNSASPENNVWNSKSPDLEDPGIDIDTFNITWLSNILEPDDSSAEVDMYTGTDSWNLVYIILSFRSSTVTGGTVTYLITG